MTEVPDATVISRWTWLWPDPALETLVTRVAVATGMDVAMAIEMGVGVNKRVGVTVGNGVLVGMGKGVLVGWPKGVLVTVGKPVVAAGMLVTTLGTVVDGARCNFGFLMVNTGQSIP